MLSGCSFEYEVMAQQVGDEMRFVSRENGDWLRPKPCIDNFEVLMGEKLSWSIRRTEGDVKCENDFPLTYGKRPSGFIVITPPAALERGRSYRILGYGRVMYEGTFRYAGSPQLAQPHTYPQDEKAVHK